MGSKPTISTGRLRKAIREVCNMAPGYGKTDELIADAIKELLRVNVDAEELRQAIEWNHSEDYLRLVLNKDTDEKEWFITPHGIAKESIK